MLFWNAGLAEQQRERRCGGRGYYPARSNRGDHRLLRRPQFRAPQRREHRRRAHEEGQEDAEDQRCRGVVEDRRPFDQSTEDHEEGADDQDLQRLPDAQQSVGRHPALIGQSDSHHQGGEQTGLTQHRLRYAECGDRQQDRYRRFHGVSNQEPGQQGEEHDRSDDSDQSAGE